MGGKLLLKGGASRYSKQTPHRGTRGFLDEEIAGVRL
jgi:hypothetical protein